MNTYRIRLDAEYYKKDFLENEKFLNGKYRISNYCDNKIKNIKKLKLKKNFNYLEISNVSLNSLEYNTMEVAYDDIPDRATYVLKNNDIVVSTVRPNRNAIALIINPSRLVGTSGFSILRLNKKIEINLFYLYLFCKTKFFISKLMRENTASMYPAVTDFDILDIKIPTISNVLEKSCEKLVKLAYLKFHHSNKTFKKAEKYLIECLGGLKIKNYKSSVNIKGLQESFLKSYRLDAEFYQPKYDVIEDQFNAFERIKLRDLVNYPISSGITPKAGGDDYTDEIKGIPFVRAVDLQDGEISTSNFIYIKPKIHSGVLNRTQLKKNDVLFSIAGTVGRCSIFNHEFEANINQAVSILRFEETKILRLYLVVFFNSTIGKEFVSKYSRQGLQTNLNLVEVGNLSIPIINITKQKEIAELVEESFNLKKESEKLIEVAKRAVEIAIERNEKEALKFIEENK